MYVWGEGGVIIIGGLFYRIFVIITCGVDVIRTSNLEEKSDLLMSFLLFCFFPGSTTKSSAAKVHIVQQRTPVCSATLVHLRDKRHVCTGSVFFLILQINEASRQESKQASKKKQ